MVKSKWLGGALSSAGGPYWPGTWPWDDLDGRILPLGCMGVRKCGSGLVDVHIKYILPLEPFPAPDNWPDPG